MGDINNLFKKIQNTTALIGHQYLTNINGVVSFVEGTKSLKFSVYLTLTAHLTLN